MSSGLNEIINEKKLEMLKRLNEIINEKKILDQCLAHKRVQ